MIYPTSTMPHALLDAFLIKKVRLRAIGKFAPANTLPKEPVSMALKPIIFPLPEVVVL